jgi:hypothetical protein
MIFIFFGKISMTLSVDIVTINFIYEIKDLCPTPLVFDFQVHVSLPF